MKTKRKNKGIVSTYQTDRKYCIKNVLLEDRQIGFLNEEQERILQRIEGTDTRKALEEALDVLGIEKGETIQRGDVGILKERTKTRGTRIRAKARRGYERQVRKVQVRQERLMRTMYVRTTQTQLPFLPTPDGATIELPNDPTVRRVIRERTVSLLQNIRETNTKRFASRIAKHIRVGASRQSIINDYLAESRELARNRSQLVLTTETTYMRNAITLEATKRRYRYKRWFTQLDERVRHAHRRIHGQSKRVNDLFLIIYPKGRRLRIPYPQEPRCRCFILPSSDRRRIRA